ncbi:MAG TPA: hypothetical protein VFD27_12335 [Chthoniobacteraceae bacterium]|nr:hypothetical protein [Chthoniobacteraceae bacterium]
MTPRELYSVERARYMAKRDAMFAEIRLLLPPPAGTHVAYGKTVAYRAAWYERNKDRIAAERAAKRTPRLERGA